MRGFVFAVCLVFLIGKTTVAQEIIAGGPLTDIVERRIEALGERLESSNERRFEGVLAELRESREESKAMRQEYAGALATIREMRVEFQDARQQWAADRAERQGLLSRLDEVVGKWTPVQNLVDRLTRLVWKIFWLLIAVAVVVSIVGVIALAAYSKVSSLVKKGVGL
jgi:chromosome segregation ATPase